MGSNVLLVLPHVPGYSETFLKTLQDQVASNVVTGSPPMLNGEKMFGDSLLDRACHKINQRLYNSSQWSYERAFGKILKSITPGVVLAQYGPIGVRVLRPCKDMKIPLIVHFRGEDATRTAMLDKYSREYQELFDYASAIIAVSEFIKSQLVSLGAQAHKILVIPSGADTRLFEDAKPIHAPPTFISVGRFVEKKAPYLTLLAFELAARNAPDFKLKMIGDGPLLEVCQNIAVALGIENKVFFTGSLNNEQVAKCMRESRAYVQHSIRASDGNSEGLPLAVQEAMAAGLPVIATSHAGIPEAITQGESGFLVSELDIRGMATAIRKLGFSAELAQSMGERASEVAKKRFSAELSIHRLEAVIDQVVLRHSSSSGASHRY